MLYLEQRALLPFIPSHKDDVPRGQFRILLAWTALNHPRGTGELTSLALLLAVSFFS